MKKSTTLNRRRAQTLVNDIVRKVNFPHPKKKDKNKELAKFKKYLKRKNNYNDC